MCYSQLTLFVEPLGHIKIRYNCAQEHPCDNTHKRLSNRAFAPGSVATNPVPEFSLKNQHDDGKLKAFHGAMPYNYRGHIVPRRG